MLVIAGRLCVGDQRRADRAASIRFRAARGPRAAPAAAAAAASRLGVGGRLRGARGGRSSSLGVVYDRERERGRGVRLGGPPGLRRCARRSATSSLPSRATSPSRSRSSAAGQQWIWRYEYPDGTFSYYELVVPVDTAVVVELASTDVVHRWWVPGLGGKFDAVPGQSNQTWFKADEEGSLRRRLLRVLRRRLRGDADPRPGRERHRVRGLARPSRPPTSRRPRPSSRSRSAGESGDRLGSEPRRAAEESEGK